MLFLSRLQRMVLASNMRHDLVKPGSKLTGWRWLQFTSTSQQWGRAVRNLPNPSMVFRSQPLACKDRACSFSLCTDMKIQHGDEEKQQQPRRLVRYFNKHNAAFHHIPPLFSCYPRMLLKPAVRCQIAAFAFQGLS